MNFAQFLADIYADPNGFFLACGHLLLIVSMFAVMYLMVRRLWDLIK